MNTEMKWASLNLNRIQEELLDLEWSRSVIGPYYVGTAQRAAILRALDKAKEKIEAYFAAIDAAGAPQAVTLPDADPF